MPIPITKYTCQFKCGLKAQSKSEYVSKHENDCWKNPENKTCKTCSNEIIEHDSDDFRGWINRCCKLDSLNSMLGNIHEKLENSTSANIKPIKHCRYHNAQADENIHKYANLVEQAIKNNETEFYISIKWPE